MRKETDLDSDKALTPDSEAAPEAASVSEQESVEQRLRQYTRGVQQLRERDFQVGPYGEHPEPVVQELGDEIQALGSWLEARFNEFATLQRVSVELNKGVLVDDVLSRVYSAFRDVIPYDRIGCALIENDGKTVTAYWARSEYEGDEAITRGYSAPLKGSSLDTILQTGKPRIINDLEAYLREKPDSASTQKIVSEGIRSSLTCPLLADGKPVGFLFFSSREKHTYEHLHQEVFLHIASQIAHLIEKSRLYQRIVDLNSRLQDANVQLKEKSARDSLTGLLNRGAILEFLKVELDGKAARHMAVILLDLDHFKAVNDTHGHVTGDLVLREVANTLRETVRPQDRVGRYGGEEFLVVLTDIREREAREVAERLRQAVAALEISLSGDESLNVTASFGLCLWPKQFGESLNTLLTRADDALYQAKHCGRNRVCFDGDACGC